MAKKRILNNPDLSNRNIFFNDTSDTSPDVFRITQFPSTLTSGKNIIKLQGNPSNLNVGSVLEISIIDSNNDPIYNEIINYLEDDGSRVIVIYIYPDTPEGDAVVILGTELSRLNNQDVPSKFIGQINTVWSKTVSVSPSSVNNEEIIFTKDPNIIIEEQIGVQLDRSYTGGSQVATYNTGTVRYINRNNNSKLLLTGGKFNSDMNGGTLTVTSPVNPLPIPNVIPTTTPIYTSKITKVLNDTTLTLESPYIFLTSQSLSQQVYNNFDDSTFSIEYNVTPNYTVTQNSQSFALMQVKNLDPDTGDVSRLKLYGKNDGSFGDYELLNDIDLTPTEIFVDATGSVLPDVSVGFLTSQSIIDTYWESKTFLNNIETTGPLLVWSTSSLMDAVIISSSDDISRFNDVHVFKTKDFLQGVFVENSEYKISFDAIGTQLIPGQDSKISIYLSGSSFNYDGTDILNLELPIKLGKKIGEVKTTATNKRYDDINFSFLADQNGLASLLFVIENGQWQLSNIQTLSDSEFGFTENYTRLRTLIPVEHKSDNQINFKLEYYNAAGDKSKNISFVNYKSFTGGNRYIDGGFSLLTGSLFVANTLDSGIDISGLKDTGFIRSLPYSGFNQATSSTGAAGFLIYSGSALPNQSETSYGGVGLELVADENNYFRFRTSGSDGKSELDIRTETIVMSGSSVSINTPTFFFGEASSQFISGANGQMEISSSGYHIQPSGDITASRILIEGGTITDNVTIQGSVSANSILTPATIGGSPSTAANASSSISDQGLAIFKSASIGGFVVNTEEIRSADQELRLKSGGQITASRVLLEGGTITDGVTILGSVTANSIRTPATIAGSPSTDSNASSSISATGLATFKSASIAGFVVNENEIRSADSSLRLKATGQVTASTLQLIDGNFDGQSVGKISGSALVMEVPTFFFGSTAQFVSGSDGNIEISSSNFHLSSSGDVKLSGNVTATSGDIGGFEINNNSISSTNNNLILSSSGQITGSTVLFTGGDIAGFNINTVGIKSSNSNLILSASGQITASNAQITGDITANTITANTTGTIANFNIDSVGIKSANSKLILSASGQITGSNFLMAGGRITDGVTIEGTVSANSILVPADLDATEASASISSEGLAIFRSASIAGFNINPIAIASADKSLILSASGQITASDAKITGDIVANTITANTAGTIASFNIDSVGIKSSNSKLILSASGNMTASNAKITGDITANTITANTAGTIAGFTINSVGIKSSNSKLIMSASGQITGSNVLLDGGEIGGFTLSADEVKSSNNNLRLKDSGQITGSDVLFDGGEIAGFDINTVGIKSSNSNLILSASGNITASNAKITGDIVANTITANTAGTIAGFNINSVGIKSSNSNLILSASGNMTASNAQITGKIVAEEGTIGGFNIGDDLDSSAGTLKLKGASGQITASAAQITGKIVAQEGTIGGFNIGSDLDSSAGTLKLKGASGQITASAAQITGKITAQEGTIGGFNIGTNLESSAGTLNLKGSTGQITGSKVLFDGGTIAGFDIDTIGISSVNKQLILSASGQITGSNFLMAGGRITDSVTIEGAVSANSILVPAGLDATAASASISSEGLAIFRSASIAGFVVNEDEIRSANSSLRLKSNGQITGSDVLFDGGTIGGFTLSSNTLAATNFELNPSGKRITLGSGNDIFIADGDEGIQLGNSTFNSAPFSVTKAGALKAISGEVGGFTLSSNTISGTNIIIDSAGSIQTSDYVSDLKGWKISADDNGFAEFENAKIRGTLSTAVFEKETVNAVGGQLYVANSTTLTSSVSHSSANYLPTDSTMSVVNASGFSIGEILSLKKVTSTGFGTEYIFVQSSSRNDSSSDSDLSGNLFVLRGYSGSLGSDSSFASASLGDSPGAAQSYSGSQVLVSTGKVGTGFIRLNANPNNQATPYIDIVERTGSAIFDVSLKARLGDLSGLAGSSLVFGNTDPGFGLATDNVYLQGGITATFGQIGGFAITSTAISSSNNSLILRGDSGQITGSKILLDGGKIAGFDINSVGIKSSNSKLILSASGNITASNANITGDIVANTITANTAGTIAGFTINSVGIKSSNSNLILSASGNMTASNAQITGKIVAESGTIGGFNIGDDLDSAAGTLKLKGASGQITASAAQITGDIVANNITANTAGTIGGFTIDSVGIKSSDSNLILSASGQITGSDVLFDGGTIGGFTITPDKIKSGTNLRLDASNKKFIINDNTFGNTGIQLEYNSGTPRAHIGTENAERITFDGSNLIMSASTFVLGSPTQFVSGANGNIEISSSNFHLDNTGNVNMSGTVTSTAGNIGGFTIDSVGIKSSNSNLILSASGQITASDANITGDIVANTITANTAGTIANFNINSVGIKSSNSNLILSASGNITASNAKITGDIVANTITADTAGTIAGFNINSVGIKSSNSNLILSASGNLTASNAQITGKIVAEEGTIGGFNIGDDLDSSAGTLKLKGASGQITASAAQITGDIVANTITANTAGTIGGFTIDSVGIRSTNVDGLALITPKLILSASGNITASSAQITGDITANTITANTAGTIAGFNINSVGIKSSNSNLILSASGNMTASNAQISGKITATDGAIGGFTIGSTSLIAGSNTTRVSLSTADGIHLGNNTFGSAPFRVTRAGAVTATNATVTGDIVANTITANTTGTIANFNINSVGIKSANSNLILSASGNITASNANITGDIVANTITANTAGTIANFNINSVGIKSANSNLILSASGNITASNAQITGKIVAESGTIGGFNIGSDLDAASGTLKLKGASGQLTASAAQITGKITSDEGTIGGWEIGTQGTGTLASSGNFNTRIKLDSATPAVTIGQKQTLTDANPGLILTSTGIALGANSPFKVSNLGQLTASKAQITGKITAQEGTIGGFNITSNAIASTNGNLVLSGSGRITASAGIIGGFELSTNKFEGTPETISVVSQSLTNTNVSGSFAELSTPVINNNLFLYSNAGDIDVNDGGNGDGGINSAAFWNPLAAAGNLFVKFASTNAFVQIDSEGSAFGPATDIAPVSQIDHKNIYLDNYVIASASMAEGTVEFVNSLTYSGTGNLVFVSSSTTTTTFNSEKQSILLDSAEKSLSIATGSFGDTGIQLQYNGGNPRFFVGTDTGSHFKYDSNIVSISSSNFTVTPAGEVEAKQIELTDYAKADYFVFKLLKITGANSGSFFENYDSGGKKYTKLVLDGSNGGSIAQSVRIEVVPQFPIGMIRPPIASNSQGHEITIECATTAVGYADKVAVSGSSAFAYGFHADSDDWFFQLFQTRVYPNGGSITYGGGSVGDIGASPGRVMVQNSGQRFRFVRSAYDFRLLGISSYDTTAAGNFNSQGLINFFSGLQTSNGPIGIGIGTGTKMTAGYAFEVQSIVDRNGTTTDDAYFHGNITVAGGFKDTSGDLGSSGQILSSTGTGTNWIANSGGGGGAVATYTNGTNNRVITSTGTDGINGEANMTFDGTNLLVSDDSDSYANIGRTRVGYAHYSDYAYVSHRDLTSAGEYALLQSAAGDTFINAKTGRTLHLRINNSSIASITAAGLNMSSGFILDGNTITGVDDSGEFTNDDAHIMTSAGVEDKILGYGYGTGDATLAGTQTFSGAKTFSADTKFSGNIGINGATSIDTPLDIAASGTGNNDTFTKWYYSPNAETYFLLLKQTVTSGVVRYNFSMMNNSTAYDDVLVLDRGNVGIGTTDPDGLLHVSAGTSGDARLILEADTDNNDENDVPQIWFKADGDITEGLIGLNNNYLDFVSNISSTGGFRFFTGTTNNTGTTDPYTNATEKLRITAAGNVGIGTTSPSTPLHVNGNVTLSGFILDGNTITGVDDSGEFTNDDAHIMTSAGVEDKILGYSYTANALPLAGGTMSGAIAMGDNDVTGIDELIFTGGTKLGDAGADNYLRLTYGDSGAGGIEVFDGDGIRMGYLYADGSTSFGLVDGSGAWAVRCLKDSYVELRHDNSVKFQTNSGGVTITGNATLSGFVLDGNTITGVDDSGEFTNDDAHIMTSAGVEDKILGYGYSTTTGTVTGTGASTRVALWNSTSGLTSIANLEATAAGYEIPSGNGNGLRFWNGSTNYAIYMSADSITSTTVPAQQFAGAGASDYNLYFRMMSGTNRGFVFLNDQTAKFQIEGSGAIHTAGNANIGGNIKLGSGGGIFIENSSAALGGQVIFPGGGMYRTSTNTHTGAIKIAIPSAAGTAPADMLSFWVDVFDYTTNESFSVFIGGYAYQQAGSNEWTNQTAVVLSTNHNKNYTVRFGHDGTSHCVLIGETNSSWSYPQVAVRDVQIGYSSDVDAYDDGWTISFVTSLPTIDETSSNNFPFAQGLASAANIPVYFGSTEEFRFETDGDFHADGDVIASSTSVSDIRLKDNIIPIGGALDKIKSLRGVSYTWNAGKKKGKQDIGLIAQEVEEVIPEIVKDKKMPLMDGAEPDETYKTIDYEKIIAVLVEAVKDQQTQIDDLKKQIEK